MIRFKKIHIIDFLSYAALFTAFICASNGELTNTNSTSIYYLPFAVCAAALLLECIVQKKIHFPSYVLWRVLVLIFFIITLLYAIDYDSTFTGVKRYLLQTIVVLLLAMKCWESQESRVFIVKLCVLAILINMIYVFSETSLTLLFSGHRLGKNAINRSWNANSVGMTATFAAILTIYLYLFHRKTRQKKETVFCALLTLFFTVTFILSGSRKTILLAAITFILYYIFYSKSHLIRNILLSIIAISAILYALYAVPFLYNSIGYRLENLFDFLSGTGGDGSISDRRHMIEVGLEAFLEKPFFGYGINCFKIIYGEAAGWTVYSHNNYIELLVGTGFIGLLVYYLYILQILLLKNNGCQEIIFIKSLLTAMLLCEMAMVSYYDSLYQYILCMLLCSCLSIKNRDLEGNIQCS